MRRLLDQGLTIASSSLSPPNSSAPRQHVPGPPSEKSTAATSNNVNNYHNSTSWASTNLTYQRVDQLKTTLHTSTALIILLLLSALCFLGFCSIYIRRLSVDNASREISSGRVRRRRPRSSQGLQPAEIGNLPHYAYHSGGNEKGVQTLDCAVCLSEFEEMEIVKALPLCRHAFHQQCIDVWLSSNSSCPLCRSSVLLPSLCCLSGVEEVARTTLSIATAESDTSQNRGGEEMGGSNSPAAAREEENEGVSFVVGVDRSWDFSSGCSLPVLCS